jgi:hypothetical protein
LVFAALVVVGATVTGTPAQAQEYPWCAQYGGGGRNCGFISWNQCMAARSGNGGFCERNLFYPRPDVRRDRWSYPRWRDH